MGRDVDGLFQQFKVASCRNVFLLPKTIPLEIGPLVQPFSTVVHAHSQVTIDPGDNVALLGLGVNGLMLAQVAKLRGARVIGVDIVPARLELAKSLGVDVVVNSSEVDPLPQVMSVTDGYGADLVIEAVGLPELVRKGMQMLRPRGTLLQFGISSKEAAFDMYDAYIKEVVLKTTRSSLPRDFEKAIAIVQQGTVDLRYLISKVFRFEEATEAIRFFRDRARVLRVILKT